MKRCPKCNSEWPDAANFCPVDGGELVDITPPADPSEAATRVMPAASEAPAAPKQPVQPAQPARQGEAAKAAKKRRFSETAWFMAAQSPEELGDVEVGQDAELATEKYIVDGELDADVRDKFSLRKRKGPKGGGDGSGDG